jgi:hypothetical protein
MEKNKKDELDKKWNAIVLKALKDEEFKSKLIKNPTSVMVENGLSIPEGCKVGETSKNTSGLQLPPNASDDIKEEAIWWKWRLEMTHDFGKDEKKKESFASGGAPLMDASPEM